jgi:hypothetical protein
MKKICYTMCEKSTKKKWMHAYTKANINTKKREIIKKWVPPQEEVDAHMRYVG